MESESETSSSQPRRGVVDESESAPPRRAFSMSALQPSSMSESRPMIKVVLVGSQWVGKTSLCRVVTGEAVRADEQPTRSAEIYTVAREFFNVKLFDYPGQQSFRAWAQNVFRRCRVVLLVFAINDGDSFAATDDWFRDYQNAVGAEDLRTSRIFLIGTKCDLEASRRVSSAEARSKAAANGWLYFEVSAVRPDTVEQLMKVIDDDDCTQQIARTSAPVVKPKKAARAPHQAGTADPGRRHAPSSSGCSC